jgi:hypothetical protein
MTWEELRGAWYLLRAKVQQQWDKLSNEDMDFIQEQFRLVPRKLTGPRGNGLDTPGGVALGFSNANDAAQVSSLAPGPMKLF